jgi:predicted transcriptional regulator
MSDARRTRVQIYIAILRAVERSKGKIKRTHIVYKANLTHTRLDSYLNTLISREFLTEEINGRNKSYKITDKGLRFLSNINRLKGIADAFGVPL